MSKKEALLPAKRIFLQPILPLKCATAQTICAVKSHLAHLRHSKTKKKHENKKLFELNVYFVRILIRFYILIQFFKENVRHPVRTCRDPIFSDFRI